MTKKAFSALILCALFAGTSGLFVKSMTSLTPSAIAWYRTAVPSVVMALWVFQSGRNLFRGNNRTMIIASAINALRLYLYLVAFIYTSIGNAIIISYTWPIFVTIFSFYKMSSNLLLFCRLCLGKVAFLKLTLLVFTKCFFYCLGSTKMVLHIHDSLRHS